MTRLDFEYIKDAFSQIIDDIAGNPDWHDATRAVASDIGTLEKLLEKRVVELPNDLEEMADNYEQEFFTDATLGEAFIAGAEWGAERFAKIVRANLTKIDKSVQSQFEQLYMDLTGNKMYGGYND